MHSAILSTFIKLQFVIKIVFLLFIFEWPLKIDFAVTENPIHAASNCTLMCILVHVDASLVPLIY